MKNFGLLLLVGAMATGTSPMYAADAQNFGSVFGDDPKETTGVHGVASEREKRPRAFEITAAQPIPSTLSSLTTESSDVQCSQRPPVRHFTEAQRESTESLLAFVAPTQLRAADDRRDESRVAAPFASEYERVLDAGRMHIDTFIASLTEAVVAQHEKNEIAAKAKLEQCVEQGIAKLLTTLKDMSSSRQGLVTRKALLTLICEMATKALEACEEEGDVADGSATLAAELGALIATKAAEMMAKPPVRATRVLDVGDADMALDGDEVLPLVRSNASSNLKGSTRKAAAATSKHASTTSKRRTSHK